MKKIISITLVLLFALALFACGGSDESGEVSTIVVTSKTEKFYTDMDKNSFYFKMNFTQDGEKCVFEQATNGKNCTTRKDFDDDTKDIYDIFNGTQVDHIVVDEKLINTTVTKNGQNFLFAGYKPSSFAHPSRTENRDYNGKQLPCEVFLTSWEEGGAIDGENRYYYDGDKLVCVEIVQKGEIIMLMEFLEYGNVIPETIFAETPADYKKGNIEFEVSVDTSGWWDD